MELTRVFLLSALFLVAFLLWQAWQNDYPAPANLITKQPSVASQAIPLANSTSSQSVVTPTKDVASTTTKGQLVQIKTDVLAVIIDTLGGNIIKADLLQYPEKVKSQTPFQLLSNEPVNFYVAQSGLIGTDGPDSQQGQAVYTVKQTNYSLPNGQEKLVVDLTWQNKSGLQLQKRFTFYRNSYLIDVSYAINNRSNKPWSGQLYTQIQRKKLPPAEHSLFAVNPYVGGAISSPEKPYEKISFDKMAETNLNKAIQGGWAAMLQHYFLSAWIPNKNETFTYYTHANGDIYTLGAIGQTVTVAPNAQQETGSKLYIGPENMERLKAISPNLDLTVDYGILWFISIAIFWLMKQIFNIVGNWGWSIVLVTVIIKLLFYQLSAKSYRSMASMRKLQPRLAALKERYGEDRQRLTQATMELYRNEKINPLGGCLPVLVQIPVFIALYWVLLESVELRQAPFILWIHDLSIKDPFYVLPILMGVTMYIQQRLNPPPPDPVQAKMMQFLPVFFTFLFLNFPAGLVLYWLVNNTLSIVQQRHIMRKVEGLI